jgi:toxin ParE1/3/4
MRDIEAYTRARWGAAQWEDYLNSLERAFTTILHNPEIGRTRPELGENVRAHVMREHVIVGDGVVQALRIRHGWSDPRRALRGHP